MSYAHATQSAQSNGAAHQDFGEDPLEIRETGHYKQEYVESFVDKWDELIDWDARAESEGGFFIQALKAAGKHRILDVSTGTGFHSVQLLQAGFDVTSVDGSAEMLAKAFENAKQRGLILKTVQADWRWLNRAIFGKYDAIICLGNSFTHLHDELDRRRVLAEFYAALRHDGMLILDQRNYDAILDVGFDSKHKYYYCGDQVVAEPEHMDDSLARFRYSFPDGSVFHLNMFPLRKNYVRTLLKEAGFQSIRSYGDFHETYADHDPDFFIHVASKHEPEAAESISNVAEAYYDSSDADEFYFHIWGGEDIHIGLYDSEKDSIGQASHRTVETMADSVKIKLGKKAHVADLGSGFGGAARYLAKRFGCHVTCLNISEVENTRNRKANVAAGLDALIDVKHGNFEDIPLKDASLDLAWSQDAILHSGDRDQVIAEVARVLKPGGEFVFTDPMQADDCPEGVLQPVYDRIHLSSLGSVKFYRTAAARHGLELVDVSPMPDQLRNHYARVKVELQARYDEMCKAASKEYVDRMLVGLQNWVDAADKGYLNWGILHFRKR